MADTNDSQGTRQMPHASLPGASLLMVVER